MANPFRASGYRFPVPYIMYHAQPNGFDAGGGQWCPTNYLGFRIEGDFMPEKPRGEVRVFMLGGSCVFVGKTVQTSIPGQVELMFARDGATHVKVYNFGMVSGVSGQELSLLVHRLSDYNPDAIIMYNGTNDIAHPWDYDPRPGYPYNFFLMEGLLNAVSYDEKEQLYIKEIHIDLGEHQRNCGFQTDLWERAVVENYVNNVRKASVFCKALEIPLFVFLQTALHFKKKLVGREPEFIKNQSFNEYILRQYERARVSLGALDAKIFDRNRFLFNDLSRVIADCETELFGDFAHTIDEGNTIIAQGIYEQLRGHPAFRKR